MVSKNIPIALTIASVWLAGLIVSPSLSAEDGATGEGAEGTLSVGDPCEGLAQYEPAPDVAYKPGVDVEGNAVAPADLPGADPLIGPEHEYKSLLEVPLEEVTDTSSGSGVEAVAGSNIQVGELTVVGDDVTFNGRPLDDPDTHAVAEACARRQSEGRQ